jgi:hypothetical protein
MSEEVPAKTAATATTWTTVCIAGIVVYLLSPGFFVAADTRWNWEPNGALRSTVKAVYLPLEFAVKWKPIGDFYEWYLGLCNGRRKRTPP